MSNMTVLAHVNQAKIQKANLKIKSFYLFHKCQFQCYKDISNPDNDLCLHKCEKDLDKFYEFKRSLKIQDKLFYGLNSGTEKEFKQDEIQQFKRKVVENKLKLQEQIQKISDYLNDWEKKIN